MPIAFSKFRRALYAATEVFDIPEEFGEKQRQRAEEEAKGLYIKTLYESVPLEQRDFIYLHTLNGQLSVRLSCGKSVDHIESPGEIGEYNPDSGIKGNCTYTFSDQKALISNSLLASFDDRGKITQYNYYLPRHTSHEMSHAYQYMYEFAFKMEDPEMLAMRDEWQEARIKDNFNIDVLSEIGKQLDEKSLKKLSEREISSLRERYNELKEVYGNQYPQIALPDSFDEHIKTITKNLPVEKDSPDVNDMLTWFFKVYGGEEAEPGDLLDLAQLLAKEETVDIGGNYTEGAEGLSPEELESIKDREGFARYGDMEYQGHKANNDSLEDRYRNPICTMMFPSMQSYHFETVLPELEEKNKALAEDLGVDLKYQQGKWSKLAVKLGISEVGRG